MLKPIIVNLRHALHNRTHCDIGGGLFTAEEVKAALDDLKTISEALFLAEATIERLAHNSAKLASVQGTLNVLTIARLRLGKGV